jgi:hypothetical protein
MKYFTPMLKMMATACFLAAVTGCKSTDNSSGSTYYDAGLNDPWYYGGAYHDDISVVTPPNQPVKPTHPIAPRPTPLPMPTPTPLPSVPRAPAPRAR